jgi:hypothetical protein
MKSPQAGALNLEQEQRRVGHLALRAAEHYFLDLPSHGF